MKIGIYDIINDPLPKLYKIKDIDILKSDLEYDKKIVSKLNTELQMSKLDSEHIYALSLTYGMIARGIIQVSTGKCDCCEANLRGLAIGLLLTGAEQFMCFHNHPGGNREISDSDRELTEKYRKIGELIGIHFLRHIMITSNFYGYCEEEEKLPFTE